MQDIRSLNFEELKTEITELGEKPFRADQVYGWLHRQLVTSYDEMTNVPRALREALGSRFSLDPLVVEKVQISRVDATRKYLFALADGNMIESVWMQYRSGSSVCVSSQAGCRMGCRFCASAVDGLARNLSGAEMAAQVYRIQKDTGGRVSHVVVMGSGEPFDNYENVVRFLRTVSDERGLHISQRNLTVSTCGVVPGIRRFAGEGLGVTLALSLHAPNDKLRQSLMPIAKRYPLAEVLDACRFYYEKTGRRVTYEYSLISGVNDGPRQAEELAVLLRDLHGLVNLIPVNPVKERNFKPSSKENVRAFKDILEENGIAVTVRRRMGSDIDAACGQLRRSVLEKR